MAALAPISAVATLSCSDLDRIPNLGPLPASRDFGRFALRARFGDRQLPLEIGSGDVHLVSTSRLY